MRELVVEYDIPIRDRRKYESLLNGIDLYWFENIFQVNDNVHDEIVQDLLNVKKIPRHCYKVMLQNAIMYTIRIRKEMERES